MITLFSTIAFFATPALSQQKLNIYINNILDKPIVIKSSHIVKKETPNALASLEFKRIMKEKIPRKILVEVYVNNKLFKDKEDFKLRKI